MPVDTEELRRAAESLKGMLIGEHQDLLDDGLEEALEEKVFRWMLETQAELSAKDPYTRLQYDYDNSSADYIRRRTTRESLCEDIHRCPAFGEHAREYWIKECGKVSGEELFDLQKRLLEIWNEHLRTITTEWSFRQIDRKRSEYVDSMEAWLRFIRAARELAETMGIGTGLLWDMAPGELFKGDNSEILKWAECYRKDPVLRSICDMLGHEMISSRNAQEPMEVPQSLSIQIPDRTLAEELSGIETGHRIEDLLPSEMGLMDDPDLEVLFNLKYAEDRLMCFTKQGYTSVESEITETVLAEKSDDGFAGPVIICMDTSGSMAGTPEYIAKGVTLSLTMRAHSESRRCYIINFSKTVETMDVTPSKGLSEVMEFMQQSFHGGTDMAHALEKAVDMLEDEEYRKADVLMISDFVLPPDHLDFMRKSVSESRSRKCRFHSLTIGNFAFGPDESEIFDVCWRFNPATNTIKRME